MISALKREGVKGKDSGMPRNGSRVPLDGLMAGGWTGLRGRHRQRSKGIPYQNDDPMPVNDASQSFPEPHSGRQGMVGYSGVQSASVPSPSAASFPALHGERVR